jgi:hypothetical protein
MHKKIVSMFFGVAFLVIFSSSPSFSASDVATSQANYLSAARIAVLQAQAVDNAPELAEALKSIRSVGGRFVETAKLSLREALVISPRDEIKAAINQISGIVESQPLAASAKERARTVGVSQGQDESWLNTLLSVLAPLLAASVAIAVIGTPRQQSGKVQRRWFAPSRHAQAQLDEILNKLKDLATDLSVPDEHILAMRNEARNLRRAS